MKDQLPAELEELLAAERAAPAPPAGRAEAVWDRLDATLGGLPPGGGGAGGASGAGGAWLAGGALLAVVGGVALHGPSTPAPRPSLPPPPALVAAPPEVVPAEPPAPPIEDIEMPPDVVARKPAAAPAPDAGFLDQELVLVQAARAALAAGQVDAALAAVGRHAQDFPLGALAEEREALYVHALALAGRDGEARARAEAFLDAYPDSIHRAAVQRVRDSL